MTDTYTVEEAWYDLDQDWLPDELKGLICRTIVRLPAEVRYFAAYHCSYIPFDNKLRGQCFPASTFTHLARRGRTMRNHWVITLNENLVKNEAQGQFTVAHEIAHAWLGHQAMGSDLTGEEKADALVESWGFDVPKYRHKVHAQYRAMATHAK